MGCLEQMKAIWKARRANDHIDTATRQKRTGEHVASHEANHLALLRAKRPGDAYSTKKFSDRRCRETGQLGSPLFSSFFSFSPLPSFFLGWAVLLMKGNPTGEQPPLAYAAGAVLNPPLGQSPQGTGSEPRF